jgi:hypothetical protein
MRTRTPTRFELAAAELVEEHGVRVRGIVASGDGAAYPADHSIDAPAATTAAGFAGVAHEIAHVGQAADGHRPSEWVKELSAWRFALRELSRRGLPAKRQAVEHAANCLDSYSVGLGLGRLQLRRLLTDENVSVRVQHGRVS